MKYLIIGTGGMGGIIGGRLAAAGKKTAFFARGEHLAAIRGKGLVIREPQNGDIVVSNAEAYGPGDDIPEADVIFVCVKGYSLDDVVPVIERASGADTVVIPILNGLNAGRFLRGALPSANIAEGCIYASAYVSAPGEITQSLPNITVIFGGTGNGRIDKEKLPEILSDLTGSGINATLAADAESAVYQKFICISAFAITDSMFDTDAGGLQRDGEPREMFRALVNEVSSVAEARGVSVREDIRAHAERWLDAMGPGVTSSMHKDIAAGRQAEIQAVVLDVIGLADELGLSVPAYRKAAGHFAYDLG